MKNLLLITLSLLFLNPVLAGEDHPLSKIVGENIELSLAGHTIAGRISDKLVFGDVSTNDGHQTSTLIMKHDHETIKTIFGNTEGNWGGVLANNAIKLVKLDTEIPAYIISVNGTEYTVRVEAEDFQNNHFIRPTYILELNGKEISASMLDGQACYKFSLHLIFMIFGTYLI